MLWFYCSSALFFYWRDISKIENVTYFGEVNYLKTTSEENIFTGLLLEQSWLYWESGLSLRPGLEGQHEEGGQPVGASVVTSHHFVLAGPATVKRNGFISVASAKVHWRVKIWIWNLFFWKFYELKTISKTLWVQQERGE